MRVPETIIFPSLFIPGISRKSMNISRFEQVIYATFEYAEVLISGVMSSGLNSYILPTSRRNFSFFPGDVVLILLFHRVSYDPSVILLV